MKKLPLLTLCRINYYYKFICSSPINGLITYYPLNGNANGAGGNNISKLE